MKEINYWTPAHIYTYLTLKVLGTTCPSGTGNHYQVGPFTIEY